MSKERMKSPELSDVLNEFVMAEEYPTRAALEEWVRKYPQFEHELVDFALTWMAEETLPEPTPLANEEYERIVNRAMSQVENLLYQRDQSHAPTIEPERPPLSSLIQSACEIGLSIVDFTKACQLDHALMVKLEGRYILPSSIPNKLIELIANALRRKAQEVITFIARPPQVIPRASYSSRDTPQVGAQEVFAIAVRSSSLSHTQKDYWLAESAYLDSSN